MLGRLELKPLGPVAVTALAGAALALAAERMAPQISSPLTVLGVLLLGLVAVASLMQPNWTLVAGFLLLAFVRIEPAPVDILFMLLIGTTLALGTARVRMPPGILLILATYVAISILSMASAGAFGTAIIFNGITIFLLALAVWLTGVLHSDPATTRRAMKAYIVGAAATSFVGVLALHLPLPGASMFLFDDFRTQGLYKDPNVFAPFLVPAACVVLEELARPRLLKWPRAVTAAVGLVLVAGIVFAFSRAAWLNFLVAALTLVAVYALRRHGLKAAARSTGALAVVALAGAAMLVATESLSFFEERTTLQHYDEDRFATQGEAYARTTDRLFGYGPGQSEVIFRYAPHSTYARVAIEQGLFGLATIIGVFGVTLVAAIRLAGRDAHLHGVGSATLLAAWTGLIANSFFVDTLHWRHLWIVAGLVWCAAASGPLAARERHVRPVGRY
jgi:O-antigen ligase